MAAKKNPMPELLAKVEQIDHEAPDFRTFLKRWAGRYSPRNLHLLWVQCPTATQLHTYRGWRSNNRQVRKGEKSIRLFAPHIVENDQGADEIARVRPITLFDVTQTDPIEDGER